MKRFLSIFLVFTIVFTLMSGISWAANPATPRTTMQGSGTAADPYQIGTKEQLIEFRDMVNNGANTICAVLTADIVFNEGYTLSYDPTTNEPLANGKPVSGLEQWVPIGIPDTSDYSFEKGWYNGTFDGQGHTISGLYCNYQTVVSFMGMSAATLFTAVGTNGVVKNVGIVNSYLRGEAAAAIVGACQGTVDRCYSNATVIGMHRDPASKSVNAFAGGIVAAVLMENAVIQNCAFFGHTIGMTVTTTSVDKDTGEEKVTVKDQFGGIVGTNGYSFVVGTSNYKNNYYILRSGEDKSLFTSNAETSSTVAVYTDSTDAEQPKGCNGRTADKVASGEVAYSLNNKQETMFYQNIDIEPVDPYPVMDKSHGTVYRVKDCRGKPTVYSNTNAQKGHVYNNLGVCSVAGCKQQAAAAWMEYQNGTRIYTDTLAQALEAVKDRVAFLELNQDAVLDGTYEITSGKLTLLLNGHTLTGNLHVNGGALEISSEGSVNGNILVSNGELLITKGNFTATSGYAIEALDGVVEIIGGEFVGSGEHSVKLHENARLSGGRFHGLTAAVALEDLLAEDAEYVAVAESGEALDMSQSAFTQIFSVEFKEEDEDPTDPDPEDPSYPGPEEPTNPDPEDPTNPDPEDPTNPNPEDPTNPDPTDPSDNWPGAPETDIRDVPDIMAPEIGNEIIYKVVDDLQIILDVDPLQGISRDELMNSLRNSELEGWDVKYILPSVSKLRTSDRLTIQVSEAGVVVSEKTYQIVILGDLNCDGMAMANDAALMTKLVRDPGNVVDEVLTAADLNQDGDITAMDAQRLIYRYYNFAQEYVSALK